jgi:hypothetical protein
MSTLDPEVSIGYTGREGDSTQEITDWLFSLPGFLEKCYFSKID